MTALELAALALASAAMSEGRRGRVSSPAPIEPAIEPQADTEEREPLEFLTAAADEDTQYYRALDDQGGEVLAGFYADGRVRLADNEHRFAGIVQSGHADLLDVANNTWSELFVRETPGGRLQLELRGGPYDKRVLTCENLQ